MYIHMYYCMVAPPFLIINITIDILSKKIGYPFKIILKILCINCTYNLSGKHC